MKYFVYIVIGVVVAAIIAGFFIVDSPAEERLRKFDKQRVGDLRMIQGEIINYWTKKSEIPTSLDNLRDEIRGIIIPTDPQTNSVYEYVVKGKETFELCAIFNGDTTTPDPGMNIYPLRHYPHDYADSGQWDHKSGRTCFTRVIDPELYKPESKR